MLRICLTHDVDRLRKTYQYVTHDLRRGRVRNVRPLLIKGNPYWNFEKIMAMEDRYGVRSTWYFLEESISFQPLRPKSWKLSLGRYSVTEKAVGEMMRNLDREGWEVGVHGSYRSFRDGEMLKREKAAVEEALGKSLTGIRQHYLNLDIPETWRLQRQTGFEYDASFGYRRGLGWKEDRLGPFLDEATGIWVLPLAIMECNLFSEANGDPKTAREVAFGLIDQAERRNAVLTVLWHPHVYCEPDFRGYAWVYEEIIKEGRRRGAEFLTANEVIDKYRKKTEAGGQRAEDGERRAARENIRKSS